MAGDGRHGLLDIERVAGIDDGQVRHAPEDRQVFGCLVARPVARSQARQGTDDLDRQILLGDGHADEVIGPPGRKHRIGGGERDEALPRETGGSAHQQLFGHTHLVEAIGIGFSEDVQVGIFAEIGSHAQDFRAAGRQLDQGFAERRRLCRLALGSDRGDHCRGLEPRFGRGLGHDGLPASSASSASCHSCGSTRMK